MAIFSTAAEPARRCDQNKNDIEEISKQGRETNTNVERLTTEVGDLKAGVGDLRAEVVPSSPLDFLPPEHEQSLRLLECRR